MDNDYIEPETQNIYIDRHAAELIRQYIYIDNIPVSSNPDSSYSIIKYHLEQLIKEDLFINAIGVVREGL